MKELSKDERREAILEALYRRRHDTISNLAHEFDVSVRTIKYDIEAIMRSHPIYTMQGKYGGGVYVSDGQLDNRRKFCDREEADLLSKLSKQLSGHDAEVMARMMKKFIRPDADSINKGF